MIENSLPIWWYAHQWFVKQFFTHRGGSSAELIGAIRKAELPVGDGSANFLYIPFVGFPTFLSAAGIHPTGFFPFS